MFYQLSNMLPQIFRVSSTLTLTSKHWWVEMHHKQTNGDTFILTKIKLWQVVFLVFFWERHFSCICWAFQRCTHCKCFLLKEDWIQWLTKAAAGMIFSSLQGVVLVTEFYDIVTSATSAASIPVFPFKAAISECSSYGRMQNLVFGEVVLTRWYGLKMNEAWTWKHSIVY